MFEDTKIPKGVIWWRKTKKDRQHNSQLKGEKSNHGLQNTTQKATNWATGIPQKPSCEIYCSKSANRYLFKPLLLYILVGNHGCCVPLIDNLSLHVTYFTVTPGNWSRKGYCDGVSLSCGWCSICYGIHNKCVGWIRINLWIQW